MARTLYNEPYVATPMTSQRTEQEQGICIEHRLTTGNTQQRLQVIASGEPTTPAESSVEHHFKEHQWGFGTNRKGKLLVYEVRHPHWQTIPVTDYQLDWSWDVTYGAEWAFLNTKKPSSVVFAVGSEIEVYPKQIQSD